MKPVDVARGHGRDGAAWGTASGFAAVGLWASSVAVCRLLTEPLGPLTTGALTYTLAGALGCGVQYARRGERAKLTRLPGRYLLGCGGLFVVYAIVFDLMVGLSPRREQVPVVALINYLWPALTLVLSIPILRARPRCLFPLGVLVALAGVALALLPPEQRTPAGLAAAIAANPAACSFALCAAVSWAVYSNLTRRWGGAAHGGAAPLFMLAAGLAMIPLRYARGEQSAWSVALAGSLALSVIATTLLPYWLWDLAMRRGNVTVSASAAYAIPVVATAISCAVLVVRPSPSLLGAAVLIVAGAVIGRLTLRPAARCGSNENTDVTDNNR